MPRAISLILGCALIAGCRSGPSEWGTLSATLYNNTKQDLCVGVLPKGCTPIPPGGSAHVVLRSEQWITFGILDKRYRLPAEIPNALRTGKGLIQVESDSRMFVLPNAVAPVQSLPRQPAGFPLVPDKTVDLT